MIEVRRTLGRFNAAQKPISNDVHLVLETAVAYSKLTIIFYSGA